MRRILLFLLLAAAGLSVAAPAQAQRRRYRDYDRPRNSSVEGQTILGIHLGLSSPSGGFDDIYNSGLGIGGSIAYGYLLHRIDSLTLVYAAERAKIQ